LMKIVCSLSFPEREYILRGATRQYPLTAGAQRELVAFRRSERVSCSRRNLPRWPVRGKMAMAEDCKRLVLAFPPFSAATSPPLGICTLKGFVNRCVKGWHATAIDLNLLTHQKIFQFIARGPYLDRNAFREGALGEIALSQASEVFRGADDDEFYFRPDRYSVYADLALRLITHETQGFRALEQVYRSGAQMPPLINDFADRIMAAKPDAIGISLCYSQQLWMALCLGKALKRRTSAPVIFGGTFFGDGVEEFLVRFGDAADFIVTGEGELALQALLENMSNPSVVPGLVWKDGPGARSNPPAFEHDLDRIGNPDFSDLDLRSYYSPSPVVPILTSRGCYWRKCAFCVHYQSAGQTYRTYGIESVISELKKHVADGITNFSFVDEMIAPKRFEQLAAAIREAGLDIKYYALAKPVRQFTRELLKQMFDSGCRYLLWGLESGNQRVLDLINKGTDIADIRTVLRDSAEAGLFNHVYIMAGFPTETRSEFMETIRFLDENRDVIHAVHRGVFHLMKGSPVFNEPEKFSITRTWPVEEYLIRGWHEFDCAQGMGREECRAVFSQVMPFLRAFNPYSIRLGNYRDHALLIYSRRGRDLDMKSREFPPYGS